MTDRPVGAALVFVALTLGGCGAGGETPDAGAPTAPHVAPHSEPVRPGRTFEVPPPPPPVAWADGGRRLAVTTYGSSSCPTGPQRVEVTGAQEVRVEIEPLFPGRDPCTADMAPRTTDVELPEGVSADAPLTVLLDHDGEQEEVVLSPAGG